MKSKLILVMVILLVSFPIVFARSGSIKLLAVTAEEDNISSGSVVDMNLEIKDGAGRVFIDSFPLTKLDTQITTRTAKQIACDFVGDNCEQYDFFYTIKSSAVIVGGPSAGAATAALTVAVLENFKINDSVAVTGTINAGDIVGSVGGLKEKISAASEAGIKTVVVPFGEMISEDNKTVNMREFGEKLNITIVEASSLRDVVRTLTGKTVNEPQRNFSISPVYLSVMRSVAEGLCNRSANIMIDLLNNNYKTGNVLDNESLELETSSINLSSKAQAAMKKGTYYSAASYCYGAGLRNTQIMLIEQNVTNIEMNKTMLKLLKDISDYEKDIDKWEINTITDLEAYMVVKERLYEAKQSIKDFYSDMDDGENDSLILELASVISRFNSAKTWSAFYGQKGKTIKIDKESLKNSCMQKIAEADERYQYVNYYLPGLMVAVKKDLSEAMSNLKSENYAMCLFLATKTKADIDSISSTLGVEENKIDLLISQRLNAAKNTIAEQNAKGMFPILGYSYYEYAVDLLEQSNENSTKATVLVYTGYALELSKLDIYFEENANTSRFDKTLMKYLLIFFLGFVVGVFVYEITLKFQKKEKPNLTKKKLKK